MEESLSVMFFGVGIIVLSFILMAADHKKTMDSAFEGDEQLSQQEGRAYAISSFMILSCFVLGLVLFLYGFVRVLLQLDFLRYFL